MSTRMVRLERITDAPPERVYRMWSDPDTMTQWLCYQVQGSLLPGARSVLVFPRQQIEIDVLAAQPSSTFRFRWLHPSGLGLATEVVGRASTPRAGARWSRSPTAPTTSPTTPFSTSSPAPSRSGRRASSSCARRSTTRWTCARFASAPPVRRAPHRRRPRAGSARARPGRTRWSTSDGLASRPRRPAAAPPPGRAAARRLPQGPRGREDALVVTDAGDVVPLEALGAVEGGQGERALQPGQARPLRQAVLEVPPQRAQVRGRGQPTRAGPLRPERRAPPPVPPPRRPAAAPLRWRPGRRPRSMASTQARCIEEQAIIVHSAGQPELKGHCREGHELGVRPRQDGPGARPVVAAVLRPGGQQEACPRDLVAAVRKEHDRALVRLATSG